MKKALITGITGQDGAYLAELLLEKGYEVHGIKRRAASFNTGRIDHLYQDPHEEKIRFVLHYGDLTDATNLIRIFQEVQPDEVYNLAAQSHVQVSFETPEYTADTDALGTLRLLEAIRILEMEKKTKFYQASSSEMFGDSPPPQNEQTPFRPRSPYAAAKVYAYWMIQNYRIGYKLFAVNGILFNHESPRRGETFVTRKITRALARITFGLENKLYLGNLNARRDWGYAGDYVEAMWLMLQQDEPDDYVLGTGESHSVRKFVDLAFNHAGIELEWKGNGVAEKGIVRSLASDLEPPTSNVKAGDILIEIDPRYFRPTEVQFLQCDPTKAKEKLGWEAKVKFDQLVKMMVDADIKALEELKQCQDVIRKLTNNRQTDKG